MEKRVNPCPVGVTPILIAFLTCLPALKADIDFNGTPRHGMRPLVVHFQDLSSYDATYIRSWSFPGGTPGSATGNTPVVTYTAAGVYDVTLRVMDPSGGKTVEELTRVLERTRKI